MKSKISGLRGRPPGFSFRPPKKRGGDSLLFCEGISLSDLANRFSTPLYVYSASTIRQRLQQFDHAFGSALHTVCYSVKANSNLTLLRILAQSGCGFDVVSGGELSRILKVAPRSAKKVVFSGVGKTVDEICLALNAGILLFNVESQAELSALAQCATKLGKIAQIALRVNPDVPAETHPYISTGLHQHKFGIPIQQARSLYREAAANNFLRIRGVSVHIGSQITDMTPFAHSMKRVAALVRDLRQDGHEIEYVDAGGGLGIAYEGSQQPDFAVSAKKYASAVLGPLRGLKLHLLLEPGRSIVAPAGALLTRVIYKKSNGAKKFIVVDAAMNDLLRPSLYKAHHEITPVSAKPKVSDELVDVVGPVCETGDFFARERRLPEVGEGDLLAILDAGAYGMSLSSNYNTRPRPAEILVDRKLAKVIRRRETLADLFDPEL